MFVVEKDAKFCRERCDVCRECFVEKDAMFLLRKMLVVVGFCFCLFHLNLCLSHLLSVVFHWMRH